MDSCVIPNKSTKSLKEELRDYVYDSTKIVLILALFSPEQIDHHISPFEWNIRQIIMHLADTETHFYQRMRKIIAEDNPVLQPFDQDMWAKKLLYEKQEPNYSLQLLCLQRKTTFGLLNLLPPEAWIRTGTKEGQTLTLYQVFATALTHIPTHLGQIENIKNHATFPKT